jgi:hypothetical protein
MYPERTVDLPDILDKLALAAQSLMDSGAPIEDHGVCYLCCVAVQDERRSEGHDPDCGWHLARNFAPADLDAVRRLARAMRYERPAR